MLPLALVGVLIAVALVGRLCYLAHPFDHDAACFIYMGKMTADGGRLGHDLVDNKFPTVGLVTSVAWRAFGTHWAGYVVLGTALSMLTAVILARSAKDRLATFCFALVFLNFTPAVFGGFQLETIQVFFAALAAAAIIRAERDDWSTAAFVAGMCGGCAAMLKPTGLAVLAAGMIFIAFRRPRSAWRHLIAMTAGVAVPAAAVVCYLSMAGILDEMPALARQISTYASNSVIDRFELIKLTTAVVILSFPFLIRFVVFRNREQVDLRQSEILFPVVWLTMELIGVIAQRRMYAYHFLPVIPPAALLFGAHVGRALPAANVRRAVPALRSLIAALAPIAALSVLIAFAVTRAPEANRAPVADYLADHALPGDTVWSEQWPRTVLQTGLSPGSRFASTFLFANYDAAGLDYSAVIISDFEKTRPAFIVLPANLDRQIENQSAFIPELAARPRRAANYAAGWNRIRQYTLSHYSPVAAIGSDVVYRRR